MSHGVYRPRFALHSSAGGHWQFASASWLLPITWICLLVLHPEGIARSYFIFSIFKNRSMVLHSGCTISHSHQHGTKVPVKFHPQPHVLFAGFYCYCCLFWEESCWWGEVVSHFGFDLPYPNVHWCQISFLGLCILSWKKSQIKSFTHFKTGCSLFCWVTGVPYIFWTLTLSDVWFTSIFFHCIHCIGCLFTLLIMSFHARK